MKATVKAPANIALIKFWGKKDRELRLPVNSSISINLTEVFTTTSVEFTEKLDRDLVMIDGFVVKGKESSRVVEQLNRIRKMAKLNLKAEVVSKNNFPKGTGLASSASGFAALSMAAATAANLNLTEKQLSILARVGSGSACRSIPDGWVKWKSGSTNQSSYAYSLYQPDYWDICDVIGIVDTDDKKISSSEGHTLVQSSPFYKARIKDMPKKISEVESAIDNKDFTRMGEIVETEAVNMHSVMMTSVPPLFYWAPATLRIINFVRELREKGLESYFTIDAGPNVHIFCQKKDAIDIKNRLVKIDGVKDIRINFVAQGAKLVKD